MLIGERTVPEEYDPVDETMLVPTVDCVQKSVPEEVLSTIVPVSDCFVTDIVFHKPVDPESVIPESIVTTVLFVILPDQESSAKANKGTDTCVKKRERREKNERSFLEEELYISGVRVSKAILR